MENNVVEKTLKELKAELVTLGMPESDVDAFNSKAQIMAVLNTMKAKEVVKRVDSIEEIESPKEKKMVEKQYLSKARIMRDKLMSQPKVRYLIPCEPKERPGVIEWRTDKNGDKYQVVISGAFETVQLNGFKWFVPKGVFTDVPEQVAEELGASHHLTNEAGKEKSMDRTDPQTGKVMSEAML